MKKRINFLIFVVFTLFAVLTCKPPVSLGATVDILPPKGKILYPDAGETPIRGTFVLKGKASDDEGVKSVSIKFKNVDTGWESGSYAANIEAGTSGEVLWSVTIPNEVSGRRNGHPLVKEYPIPDGTYTAIVTITDKNGKTTAINREYSIDNTPPVFIVSRPSTIIKKGESNSAFDPYGAVFRVVGQAEDKHKIEELTLQVKDESGNDANVSITKKFVGKNINEEVAIASKNGSEYTDPLYKYNKDNSYPKIRAHLFLRDNARLFKDGTPSGFGNTSEWYYMRDKDIRWVLEQGYTADIINDYFAGKRGNEQSQKKSDILLAALYGKGNAADVVNAAEVKNILESSLIIVDKNEKFSFFTLNPNKSPGFKVTGVRNLAKNDSFDLKNASRIFYNKETPPTLLIDLIPNKDGDPLVESYTLEGYKKSGIEVCIFKWDGKPNSTREDSLKNEVNLEEVYTFKFSDLDSPDSKMEVKLGEDGKLALSVKLSDTLPQDQYIIRVRGKDNKKNDFEAYDLYNSPGGVLIGNFVWVGDKPIILPVFPPEYVNKAFAVAADVSALGEGGIVRYSIDREAAENDKPLNPKEGSRYEVKDVWPSPVLSEGKHTIYFMAKDNRNQIVRAEKDFIVDTKAPVVKMTYPDPSYAQSGNITVMGSLEDEGIGVKHESTKYIIVKKDAAKPTVESIDKFAWKNMTKTAPSSWEFSINLDDHSSDASQYGDLVESDVYDIPVYILSEDKIENKSITQIKLRYDAEGSKPVVKINSPQQNQTLGGTIQIFGTASTRLHGSSPVGEVYIQFSKNGKFDGTEDGKFGTSPAGYDADWYKGGNGQPVPGTSASGANWQITINKNKEFDNPNGDNWFVYFRLRAKNKDNGTMGKWSSPVKIEIDKAIPTIGSPELLQIKNKDNTGDTDNYSYRRWLPEGKKLIGSLYDEAGIKELSISSAELLDTVTYDLNQAKSNGWIAEDTAHSPTGGSAKNYKLQIPLDIENLSESIKRKGELGIHIKIVENTPKELPSEASLTFRFDITKPALASGKEVVKSAEAEFSAGGFTSPHSLDNAKKAQYRVLVDDKVYEIDTISGKSLTLKNASSLTGKFNYGIVERPKMIYDDGSDYQITGIASDTVTGVQKVIVKLEVGGKSTQVEMTRDNDGIKLERGDMVSFKGSLNTEAVNNGKGKLTITAVDERNNTVSEDITEVIVKNKPVKISSLVFKTDLSGDGTYNDGEVLTRTNPLDGLNEERDFRKTEDVSSLFTFKNPAKSEINIVLADGKGSSRTVKLYKDSISNSNLIMTQTEAGNSITLDLNGKFGNGPGKIEDAESKKLILLVFDERSNGDWYAQEEINMGVDTADDVRPRGVILPFFYNSDKTELTGDDVKLSSVEYEGGKPAGHIEISGVGSLENTHPCVSGKVILRGIAYDNIRLKKLELSGAGISGVNAEFSGGSWTSSTGLTVKTSKFSNTGHYVEWEYEWNTGTPALTQAVILKVTDAADLNNTADPAITNAEPAVKEGTRGPEDRALTLANGDKPVKHQFIRLTDENERHYLVQINEVQENNKINWFNVDVPQNITRYVLYTAESNNAQITVNIVPYITKIATKLSELGGTNDPDLYARTALGRYPVQDKEVIKIHGFNLSGAAATVGGVDSGTLADSGTVGVWNLTLAAGAKSGELEIAKGTVKAGNNINDNDKPYNKGGKTANNQGLTDDLWLDVWQFNSQAAKPHRGVITEPVMRINPSNGMIGFSFANGPDFFSMANGNSNSYTRWHKNYDDFGNVDFVYDTNGNSHGVVVGRDINSTGNHGGKFNYLTSIWGVGSLGQFDNYEGRNALRLEAIGQKGAMSGGENFILDKTRIQHPSLVAAIRTDTETRLYLAYYDGINDQIRFKYGTISDNLQYKPGESQKMEGKPPQPVWDPPGDPNGTPVMVIDYNQPSPTRFGQFVDEATTSEVKSYSEDNVSIVAGKYKNGETDNTTGTYLSLGVVSGTDAASDTAVLIWFDETSRMLKYTYKTNPQNGSHASQAGTGSGNWKKPVNVFNKTNVGEYCKIAVDKAGGIHIAAFDSDSADLKYAYLSSYSDTAFKRSTVDSYGITGTHITLDVAYTAADGKPVPYIGYYSASAGRSKLAYLVDTATGVSGSAQGTDANGFFTGKWEVSVVPTSSRVQQDNINVGVWKDNGVIKDSVTGTNSSGTEKGTVHGNGTKNPVLGYAIREAMNGYIETAQKK